MTNFEKHTVFRLEFSETRVIDKATNHLKMHRTHAHTHTIHTYIPTYIHTYIHTYTHTYTHTYIQKKHPTATISNPLNPCGYYKPEI
jgi:hypothetical protein